MLLYHMQKIINLYKQLFFLQISPEALPYSKSLLWGCISSYFLINVAIFAFTGKFSLSSNILAHTGSIFLSIAFIYIALKIQNAQVRLHKILLAVFSVDLFFLILSLIMQPFNISVQLIVAFVCMLWSLSIKTHIFSKGFNLNTFGAIVVMLGFEFIRHVPTLLLIWPYFVQQS